MQLTQHTDYALRVLLYLAARPEAAVDAPQIASAFGISLHHVRKVVFELGRLGVISTTRGRSGGIALLQDPATLRLGKLVETVEPSLAIVECFDAEHNTCPIAGTCTLERALHQARTAFLRELDRYTLADMVRSPPLVNTMLKRLQVRRDAPDLQQQEAPSRSG